MIRYCIICGEPFKCSPSDKKVTCSQECRKIRAGKAAQKPRQWSEAARQKQSARGKTDNLKMGTPAAQKSPIAGSFETHYNALIWTIKSPDNVVFTVRNLNLWIKNNLNLFSGNTAEQVRMGFLQVKRSIEGKRKHPVASYKDWQLISWRKPE